MMATQRPIQFDSFLANFEDEKRILLSAEAMLHLFRGGAVEQDGSQICMSDVGNDHLQALIAEASQKIPLLGQVKKL